MASPRSLFHRLLRLAGWTLLALVLLVAAILLAARLHLGRSLPAVEGERQLPGLAAAVTVTRDAGGVPTISGKTPPDVARALGFVHAQDRFFQMDLARRRAAGELSALIGAATLPLDRQSRVLGLRARARDAVAASPDDVRGIVGAYTAGVNAGLASLGTAPFEYVLLRARPEPWREEDCALVVASMYLQLQDAFGVRESRTTLLHETLPPAVAEFLTTSASEWETPLAGDARGNPAVPGPDVMDLRRMPQAAARRPIEHAPPAGNRRSADDLSFAGARSEDPELVVGSNNWAVAGALTADGGALLANDMHLGLGVPHVWYRASMSWSAPSEIRATGATLPGVPSLIVGSNGHVAWGFTNTTADWTDLVVLDVDPADPTRYRTPEGWRTFTTRVEQIDVARGASERVEVRETIWGPVGEPDARGRARAIAWVALRPGGLNAHAVRFASATSMEQLFAEGAQAGMPAQNLVVASRDGRIGWSIAGRIPRRAGFDGRLSTSWADGARGWNGWVAADEYPRVVAPASGRIVTANNRLVEGDGLRLLGDGGYDPGARMRQIVAGLEAIARATPRDMLRVQLDDRALFLARWRDLLLRALAGADAGASPERATLRRVVETTWTGRASPESAAYRLVREFRQRVAELAFTPMLAETRSVDPALPPTAGRGGEGPLWALVSERPVHLLATRYATWDDLLRAAADLVIKEALATSGSLDDHTWGRFNAPRIRHPLSRAVPQLGRWLDLPVLALPGDAHMPRVQVLDFGASQRMAVSPGREEHGYFHMPAGQSGHPLSPHYGDMHRAWVEGEPTPFLPGPAVHTLVLTP